VCASLYAGGDAPCAPLYARGVEGDALCALCTSEVVEGGLCLLEALEMLEAMRCVLLCMLEVMRRVLLCMLEASTMMCCVLFVR